MSGKRRKQLPGLDYPESYDIASVAVFAVLKHLVSKSYAAVFSFVAPAAPAYYLLRDVSPVQWIIPFVFFVGIIIIIILHPFPDIAEHIIYPKGNFIERVFVFRLWKKFRAESRKTGGIPIFQG